VSNLIRVSSIAIEVPTATMEVKQTRTLTSTILPSNASNKNVTWLSSNPLVATVSANGLITALTVGSTKITVTSEDGLKSAECMLTVNADVTAPSAPTNLINGTVTGNSVVLNWTASTDAVGVTGYDVYNGATFVGSTTSTTYTVNGLSASTSYNFTVKAKDFANNNSSASNVVSVTTGEAPSGFRYLKLTVNAHNNASYAPYFLEIEWMDGATSYPTTKLTSSSNANGTASVSASANDGNQLWKAFDGTYNENWCWSSIPDNFSAFPYSITLDLGAGNAIYPTALKLGMASWNGRGIQSYSLDGSNNNTSWSNLKSVTSTPTVANTNTITIPAPIISLLPTKVKEETISLYPNPVNDNLTVAFVSKIEKANVMILDLHGRIMLNKWIGYSSMEKINVSALSNGVYFVKVIANGKVMNNRFVKK